MKKVITLTIAGLMIATQAWAGTGSSGWWIFRRPQPAKPKALVSVAAVRGDLGGIFYNPAMLGTIQQREVYFLTESGMMKDDTFGTTLYGHPLKESNAGVAAGFVYYSAGQTTLSYLDANGQLQERTVKVQEDMMGMVSYGKQYRQDICIGATFKYAQSTIAELRTANSYAVDLGMLYATRFEGLTLSAAAQNIGTSSKFINKAEKLPMAVSAGGLYSKPLGKGTVGLGLDLQYLLEESRALPQLGVEYAMGMFSVNAGYKMNVEDSMISFGFGAVVSNSIDLNYAFVPSTYLSQTHRFSIGYRF